MPLINSVLDSLTSHIVVLNTQGVIVAVNKAWRQFGTENGLPEPSHSLLGANYLDTCKKAVNQPDGDEANAAQAGIAAVLAGKQESFYLEYPCHSPNQQRWFSMNVSPLQGSEDGVVVSHENITKRKLAEIALRDSESRFSAVIEASPVPMTLNDTQGNITYLNHAFVQTLGYTLNDIPTLADWWTRAYPDLHYQQWVIENWRNHLAEAIRSNQPFVPMETNITCKDDTVRTFLVGASALKDNFADIHLVTLYDITDRKQAENALKISEEHFRVLFTQAPLGIALINSLTGHIYKANQKFADIVGLSIDELQHIDWMQITHPDDVQADLDNMALMNAGKTDGFVMEKRYIHADGSIVWINLTVAKILLKEQDAPCHHCIVEDITERKKITEALSASEKEFRLLAESMPQIVWITSDDGECIYLNQQWVDYTGLSLEESYGHNWSNALHPDDQQRAWDAWQTAIHNKSSYSLECQIRRADGVYRWWLDRGIPVCDETGKIYKWFGTCTDIHELKESEKSLRIAAIAFESQEA
ncbi:MAG: PAS domain S-box protein, partial [Methylococcales bacterium]